MNQSWLRKGLLGLVILALTGLSNSGADDRIWAENKSGVLWLDEQGATIDGDFSEWEGLAGSVTTTTVYGGGHNPSDAEGFFVLKTDNKRLYIYADVRDDSSNENDLPPAMAWRGDSVEVYIGISAGQKRFEKTDSHIRLVPRLKDDPTAFGISVNDREIPKGSKAFVVFHEGGWRIEASIPLQFLSLQKFALDQAIRVEFQVNDADRFMERDRLIHWKSPADNTYHDPSSWGDARVRALEGAAQ